ncbi:MAG: hypothetical protein KC502_15210 [Myxococcales bacterium]|nr:hypothetical protein [Myxococcales bacterium]
MTKPTERPVAAIDIGSNSIFLLLVRITNGRPTTVLERVKHRARLGAAIGPDGAFSEAVLDSTVAALCGFRAVIDRHGAQVRATATAAVRQASNGQHLLERIRREARIDVEMISGQREAELVFLGVQSGDVACERALCADVGGGSTEVVVGHGKVVKSAVSVPIGAVMLSHPRLMRAPVSNAVEMTIRAEIRAALATQPTAGQGGWDRAIATSGSAQRIARIVAASHGRSPRAGIDGDIITRADLAKLRTQLASAASHDDRLAVPGMDPERADVLLGGVLIFEELSAALGIERWHVSMAGLRMGLVADALTRRQEGRS